MPSFTEEPFKILILGGSYAGLAAALNLVDLCHGRRHRFSITEGDNGTRKRIPVQVTVVDPRDGFYHLIGQPLSLASRSFAESFWLKFSDISALQTPEIRVVRGSIDSLDCAEKRASIKTAAGDVSEEYDYLVTCTGLQREYPSAPRSFTRDEHLNETRENLKNVSGAEAGVAVIGGGAVGIEIAAETKMLHPSIPITLIHSRSSLLSSEPLPDEFSAKALEVLQDSGVKTIMGARVTNITTNNSKDNLKTLTLSNKNTLTASHVINAVSKFTPTAPSYLPAEIVDTDGYIKIQPTLQFPSTPSLPSEISSTHFAAGDVAKWSGVKRAGAAMHQGHYAARNIHQLLMQRVYGTKPELLRLDEVEPGMGLAVGKRAVAYFPSLGLQEGEETRELFFQGDLGFGICYRWMQLGVPMPRAVCEEPESEDRVETEKRPGVSTAVEAAA